MKRLSQAEHVYLDSNVIIDICDGLLEGLKENIFNSVRSDRSIFPFSAAQVSEITKHPLTERCLNRLNLLGAISNNVYFLYSISDYGFCLQTPFAVCETLREALPDLNVNRYFAHLFPFEHMKAVRKQLGLDPVLLNNLSGIEAVTEIDDAISRAVQNGADAPRSMKEILERIKPINRKHFLPLWDQLGTTESHMTIGSELQGVFTLLELFGYWPDSEKIYQKGSRFTDAQHIFNASHYDLLVTRDKGMKNRAEAAFSILDISTKVLLTSEYEKHIQQN